ncbi:MAG: hypothetical protein QM651_16825 [Rhodoblastus sp.]
MTSPMRTTPPRCRSIAEAGTVAAGMTMSAANAAKITAGNRRAIFDRKITAAISRKTICTDDDEDSLRESNGIGSDRNEPRFSQPTYVKCYI